jgi:putative sigma-54 modulation protein
MLIKTTARHFDISQGLKDHVEERLGRLSKYSYPIIEAHVILSVEKYRHIAEVTLHGNGMNLAGSGEAPDMYAAIDDVVSKLESQVKRHKGKVRSRKTRKTRQAQLRILNSASVGRGEGLHDFMQTENFPIRPMNVDEAILELEGGTGAFIVFENTDTGRVTLLFRRPDGHYGMIEPK